MAGLSMNEFLTILVLLATTSSLPLIKGAEEDSLSSEIVPLLQRIFKQNPNVAACILMKTPSKHCYQMAQRTLAKRLEFQVDDENKCPIGSGCGAQRPLEDSSQMESGGGVPSIGPKRFYNSW